MKITIPYIADFDIVSKRGHTIIMEYQEYFNLSDHKKTSQIEQAFVYIRYWDILRICCGMQMSADWRNQLRPLVTYKQHHYENSSAYTACEMYNMSNVEKPLMKTCVSTFCTYTISWSYWETINR